MKATEPWAFLVEQLMSRTRSALGCEMFFRGQSWCEVDWKASDGVEGALRGWSYCSLKQSIPLTCGAKLMAVAWEIKNTNVVLCAHA